MPRVWSKIEGIDNINVPVYIIENEDCVEIDLTHDINLQMTSEKQLKTSAVFIKNCPNLNIFNRSIKNNKNNTVSIFCEIFIENCPKLMHISLCEKDPLNYINDNYVDYCTDSIFYWQYYKLLKFMEKNIDIEDRITLLENQMTAMNNVIYQQLQE